MRMRFSIFSLLLLSLMTCTLHAGAWVGYSAPQFTGKDILTDRQISLSDYLGKVVIIEWMNCYCPYVVKQYSSVFYNKKGHVQSVQEKFTRPPYDMVWISLVPMSKGEEGYQSPDEWKVWLKREGAFPSVFILDESKDLARLFAVTRLPEFFVINADGIVVYKGAMDSIRSTDPTDISRNANRCYLESALMQLAEGKPVFTQETIPYGCPLEL